tara:strand:- start:736 stop:885 length:150 start_codon:yes stop_codon:yes gene_type:complete
MEYITEKGVPIPAVSSDPSNPVEGEVWFNTTSNVLKFYDGSSNKTVTAS